MDRPVPRFPLWTKLKSLFTFLRSTLTQLFFSKRPPRSKRNAVHTTNIYFLCIGIMQLYPRISDSDGIPTTLTPLVIVIVVSGFKDLIEDLRRHRSDAEENNRPVKVCVDGELLTKTWQDLRVGDVIKVERNDAIPADLVLLGTSGFAGVSYVETKSLDGETSLKHKMAIPEIARFFTSDGLATRMRENTCSLYKVCVSVRWSVVATCEPPSATLYSFHGVLNEMRMIQTNDIPEPEPSLPLPTLDTPLAYSISTSPIPSETPRFTPKELSAPQTSLKHRRGSRTLCSPSRCMPDHNKPEVVVLRGPIPLGLGQFFLRGSSLVNTEWIYGLVVYVSNDTRIFQNANTQTQFKWSHLEKTYNRHVLFLVLFEVIFCLIICVGSAVYRRLFKNTWYLSLQPLLDDPSYKTYSPSTIEVWWNEMIATLEVFGSMIILFAYFVPIDLFLMLEIVRLAQGAFVVWDQEMCSHSDKSLKTISQSSHLIEELGNTTHLFTDKTGTLTRNIMTLRCISVDGRFFSPLNVDFDAQLSWEHSRSVIDAGSFDNTTHAVSTAACSILRVAQADTLPLKISNSFSAFTSLDWKYHLQPFLQNVSKRHSARVFMLSLAVCHTVLVRQQHGADSKKESCRCSFAQDQNKLSSILLPPFIIPQLVILSRDENQGEHWVVEYPPLAQYDASSPDELALVSGAQGSGVEFYQRTQLNRIQLRLLTPFARNLILGPAVNSLWMEWESHALQEFNFQCPVHSNLATRAIWVPLVTFELLEVLEFDNERKRMSVIISDPINDKTVVRGSTTEESQEVLRMQSTQSTSVVRLLTKGADSHILGVAATNTDNGLVESLTDHINQFAEKGLRTLAFGFRIINSAEHEDFNRKLAIARSEVFQDPSRLLSSNFETSVRATHLTIIKLFESLETNLTLLGATGVEDQLQQDVPFVIRELRSCGLHCWVLTGDKPETAINVGHSAQLLTEHTYNRVIDDVCPYAIKRTLTNLWQKCEASGLLKTKLASRNAPFQQKASRIGVHFPSATSGFCAKHFGGYLQNLKKLSSRIWSTALCRSASLESVDSEEFFAAAIIDEELVFSDNFPKPRSSFIQLKNLQFAEKRCDEKLLNPFPCSSPTTPLTRPVPDAEVHLFASSPNKSAKRRYSDLEKNLSNTGHSHFESTNDIEFGAAKEATFVASPLPGSPCSIWSNDSSNTQKTNRISRRQHISNSARNSLGSQNSRQQHSTEYKIESSLCLDRAQPGMAQNCCIPEKHSGSRSIFEGSTKQRKSISVPVHPSAFNTASAKEFSITVTGRALDIIFRYRELTLLFFRLARHAAVVIACRVTPKQKALLVKQSSLLNPFCTSTIAVGDGANDVAMILSADAGIGIIGKEGLQACRAADFGITEFRFLRKLLFVHGREALRRNSFLIYYGIFKNIAFCVASFCFQFFCGFTGQDIYNFWFKSLYATLFVAPTVILYAIFDRELPHYILHRSPITYHPLPPVFWPVVDSYVALKLDQCLRRFKNTCLRICNRLSCFCCAVPKISRSSQSRALTSIDADCPRAVPRSNAEPCYRKKRHCCCFLNKRKPTVPVGVKTYGTRLFLIWFGYAVYVGFVICLLPLYTLNNATTVDHTTFRRGITTLGRHPEPLSDEYKADILFADGGESFVSSSHHISRSELNAASSLNDGSVIEGRSGFDLDAVGMVVMFQCILICNLIVALAINSFFGFQALIMLINLLLFIGLWACTMWQPFITNLIPGLHNVAGMFRMIWSCTAFYFCVFISTFVCIIPILTARVFKIFFQPNAVTVVKERMLQGVFDVVIGRRRHGAQEIVVFVPQRQLVAFQQSPTGGLLQDIDRRPASSRKTDSPQSRFENKKSLPTLATTWESPFERDEESSSVCHQMSSPLAVVSTQETAGPHHTPNIRADPYTGFAFGYEETVISSPPSLWTLASLATWAGKTVSNPLFQIRRGVESRFANKSLQGQASKPATNTASSSPTSPSTTP